jgi:hypothetical protein
MNKHNIRLQILKCQRLNSKVLGEEYLVKCNNRKTQRCVFFLKARETMLGICIEYLEWIWFHNSR